jgi:hypothetical protein
MVQVSGGELQIAGTGRNPTGAGNVSGGLCWCGKDGNRVYGVWQVRARFEAGAGYGAVVGLWPQSDSQTDGTITFAGAPEPEKHTVHGHLVSFAPNRRDDDRTVAADLTAWHTYRVEWRATYVKMFIDDKVLFDSTTIPGAVPPKKPMHLILQQMVGPVNSIPGANATTPDRVTMHIDQVRVTP